MLRGQKTMDNGQKTKDKGQWTMDNGQKTGLYFGATIQTLRFYDLKMLGLDLCFGSFFALTLTPTLALTPFCR